MMKNLKLILVFFLFWSCQKEKTETKYIPLKGQKAGQNFINPNKNILKDRLIPISGFTRESTPDNSWPQFLQNLKLEDFGKPILKYDGSEINDQQHHVAILPYDIGTLDLQQCADALIRLRAEYLFQQKKYDKIGFEFTSGDYYSWQQYYEGYRPIINRNNVRFSKSAKSTSKDSYQDFRKYLDIIYTYAGTISLSKELKTSNNKTEFNIGDLIITPGSPGHVVMVVDKISNKSQHRYALAEGFTPAQSIHILSINDNPWFDIKPSKDISTPRYYFKNVVIKSFE